MSEQVDRVIGTAPWNTILHSQPPTPTPSLQTLPTSKIFEILVYFYIVYNFVDRVTILLMLMRVLLIV